MKLHEDRQGCAMAALTLAEKHETILGSVVDLDDELEVATTLSASTWLVYILANQLAMLTGNTRDEVFRWLRNETAAAFTQPQEGEQEHDR